MEVIRKKLAAGIGLTAIQTDKFKSASLSLTFLAPLDDERAAANALVPYILRRGCERYPTMGAVSQRLEELYGGMLEPVVRKRGETQCVGLAGSFLDDAYTLEPGSNLKDAGALLEQMLLHPVTEKGAFKADYVAGERENLIQAIRAQMNDKRQYATLRLIQEMCKTEAYGVDALGGERAMSNVTGESAWAAYQELLKHARVEIFYCGGAAAQEVEEALAGLTAGLKAVQEMARPLTCEVRSQPGHEPETVVERLDVTQGKLVMGFRTGGARLTRESREEYAALTVFNALYGGTATSKLFMNVREKLSLCYYASSALESLKGVMMVSSGVEFDKMDEAQREILDQLEAVRAGDFTEDELTSAKQAVVNVYKSALDSRQQLETHSQTAAVNGEWISLTELVADVERVTARQVVEAAKGLTLDTVYRLLGKEG